METFKELKQAIADKKELVWNDPDPIDENDYTITFVESLDDIDDDEDIRDYPILIQYGRCSEAEVTVNEILLK